MSWSRKPIMTPAHLRVLERVAEQPNGCWHYTGRIHTSGYGQIDIPRRPGEAKATTAYAHRVIFVEHVGDIPDGYELDHTCHNTDPHCAGGAACMHRRCVNPDHLEAVTHRVNATRGKAPHVVAWRTDTCPRGHSLLDAYVVKRTGWRKCRTCVLANMAERRRARRAELGGAR